MSYPGPEQWCAENEEAFDAVADERLERFSRCDGCAAAWKHRDGGGKWCSDCYVPRVERELREAREALERAHDLLRRLAEWDALTVADQWPLGDGPYWKRLIELERDASAAALGEGAKG